MEGKSKPLGMTQEPEEQNVFQKVLEAYVTIRTKKFEGCW